MIYKTNENYFNTYFKIPNRERFLHHNNWSYYDVITVLGVIMMWLQHRELLRCGYSIGSYYDVVTA
jgi:hypothetical protein